MTSINNQFYCNQKFKWLTINLEKFQTASCCSATPQKVNVQWLTENPGKIFNTPLLKNERELMLNNQPVETCKAICWEPESKGLPSRRLTTNGQLKTHTGLDSGVETLNIVVGSDCNMTCVYCCKFYSSAWARDVIDAPYPVTTADDRFTINSLDKVLQKLSQKNLADSTVRSVLTDELYTLYKSPTLKEVFISGGEPFLHLELSKLVQHIPETVSVSVWTGLGVDETRFLKELDKLPDYVNIVISAENIGPAYDFVRFGNTWKRFESNLAAIQNRGLSYKFAATVTNLTLPNIGKFIEYAGSTPIDFYLCSDPDFLSAEVLDDSTKRQLDLSAVPEFVKQKVLGTPSQSQITNFKMYVQEFARRRNLKLDIFPASLVDWITK